jgi:hypothetical protein
MVYRKYVAMHVRPLILKQTEQRESFKSIINFTEATYDHINGQ